MGSTPSSPMAPRSPRRFALLATLLFAAAAAILVLSLAAAFLLVTTETSLPGFDELQRQSRGPLALLVVAGGTAGSGVLAGLAAIIRLLGEGLPGGRPDDED
jgi:hypothetical protein